MVDAQAPSARRLIDAERRVHRILRARFTDALLELGVSFAQFEVMELLHEATKLHPARSAVACSSRDSRPITSFISFAEVRSSTPGDSTAAAWVSSSRPTGADAWARASGPCDRRSISSTRSNAATRTRLTDDLAACEDALRPERRPWWTEPF